MTERRSFKRIVRARDRWLWRGAVSELKELAEGPDSRGVNQTQIRVPFTPRLALGPGRRSATASGNVAIAQSAIEAPAASSAWKLR